MTNDDEIDNYTPYTDHATCARDEAAYMRFLTQARDAICHYARHTPMGWYSEYHLDNPDDHPDEYTPQGVDEQGQLAFHRVYANEYGAMLEEEGEMPLVYVWNEAEREKRKAEFDASVAAFRAREKRDKEKKERTLFASLRDKYGALHKE